MVSNFAVTFQRPLALVFLALLYAANSGTVAAQAGDFGFRFEVTDCQSERLDTFDGVFTKNLGGRPARMVTAKISLHQCSDDGNLPNR